MELRAHLFPGHRLFSPLRLGWREAAGLQVTVPNATNLNFTDWMVSHLAGSFNHNILGIHVERQNARVLCSTLVCDRIIDFSKNSRVHSEN